MKDEVKKEEKNFLSSLEIHLIDGEFYSSFRAYLVKHGCQWAEDRSGNQLVAIDLAFPPGSFYQPLDETQKICRIHLPDGGVALWSKVSLGMDTLNSISIPYVYL